MNVGDRQIKDILFTYKTIAVYGLSPDRNKPSHYVPLYAQQHGFKIHGLYPRPHSIPNIQMYTRLKDLPTEALRFVNVFRRSENIPEVVDEVLSLGHTEVLWLQLGIANVEAEARAEAAGLKVVSDRCLIIEHQKFF